MRVFRLMMVAGMAAVGCKAPVGGSPSVQVQPTTMARETSAHPYGEGREREGQRRRGGRGEQGAAPGAFDFYVLTLSWSPEFCATHGNAPGAAAECAMPKGFVLHGLWPQNNDGSYPEECSDAPGPADVYAYRDIFPDVHLLDHEWQTHGTCSGLGADAYFQAARRAKKALVVPQELVSVTSELQLTPQQVLGDFAKANPGVPADAFAMSCGNNYLTAVEECVGKDLKAVSCSGVRSCRAQVVKVTKSGE